MNIEESKHRFFNHIKTLRKQQNLSIAELAEQSGVPAWMLEQLEQNILPQEMMVTDAYKLADTFHCKIFELFQ